MGEVVATIKLMPESPEMDLAKVKAEIKSSIPENTELHSMEEEPIAFGLVAINLMVVVDDAEGGTEQIEENLSKIDEIASVEGVVVRRLR